jgi:hypothetical protein
MQTSYLQIFICHCPPRLLQKFNSCSILRRTVNYLRGLMPGHIHGGKITPLGSFITSVSRISHPMQHLDGFGSPNVHLGWNSLAGWSLLIDWILEICWGGGNSHWILDTLAWCVPIPLRKPLNTCCSIVHSVLVAGKASQWAGLYMGTG